VAAKSIFSEFNENTKKPFEGLITFTDKMINYEDSTLLITNVSQFKKYGFKKNMSFPIFILVIGIIALYISIKGLENMVAILVSLGIIAYAIRLLLKPKLFGLTIELNSGSCHYFLSKDVQGIHSLFEQITAAIKNSKPFYSVYKFENNHVTNISQSNIGIVGDNASGNTTNF
jgi:hypothetical protein